jgi:hypothetical protein
MAKRKQQTTGSVRNATIASAADASRQERCVFMMLLVILPETGLLQVAV